METWKSGLLSLCGLAAGIGALAGVAVSGLVGPLPVVRFCFVSSGRPVGRASASSRPARRSSSKPEESLGEYESCGKEPAPGGKRKRQGPPGGASS